MARKKTLFAKPEDIKVGVIGYGGAFNMGRWHIAEMKQAGMTPTAVADSDQDRLEVAQQDFPGIETYTTVTEMLKKSDVNLITIITPHNTHAALALQCLRAGRHVVCEKPLAITTAECDRMIQEAKKQNLVLSTYHNRHWDGCALQAVKEIGSGRIGEVVRLRAMMAGYGKPGDWWRSSKSVSGGILYDWGVHLLEYCLQIEKSEILEVTGYAHNGYWAKQTAWKDDVNEDDAMCVVRFSSGAWLTLGFSSIDPYPLPGWVVITGTEGTYVMDGGNYTIVEPKADGVKVTTTGPNPPGESWQFYQNIADHMTKSAELVITPEWARRPIHILDLANQSAKKNMALKTKYR